MWKRERKKGLPKKRKKTEPGFGTMWRTVRRWIDILFQYKKSQCFTPKCHDFNLINVCLLDSGEHAAALLLAICSSAAWVANSLSLLVRERHTNNAMIMQINCRNKAMMMQINCRNTAIIIQINLSIAVEK